MLIIYKRTVKRVFITLSLIVVFQDKLGLKEKRVTEGTGERKEIGVKLGRGENQALAPVHGVEPVERRLVDG